MLKQAKERKKVKQIKIQKVTRRIMECYTMHLGLSDERKKL